jgi:hypothetical protein
VCLPVWTSKDLGGRPPLASRCISLSWLFFHGGNTGSNPVGDANPLNNLQVSFSALRGSTVKAVSPQESRRIADVKSGGRGLESRRPRHSTRKSVLGATIPALLGYRIMSGLPTTHPECGGGGWPTVSSTSPLHGACEILVVGTKIQRGAEQYLISRKCSHEQNEIADRSHPDSHRDDLDGIEPASQAIDWERRISDPACSRNNKAAADLAWQRTIDCLNKYVPLIP